MNAQKVKKTTLSIGDEPLTLSQIEGRIKYAAIDGKGSLTLKKYEIDELSKENLIAQDYKVCDSECGLFTFIEWATEEEVEEARKKKGELGAKYIDPNEEIKAAERARLGDGSIKPIDSEYAKKLIERLQLDIDLKKAKLEVLQLELARKRKDI